MIQTFKNNPAQELLQEIEGTQTITDDYWFNSIGREAGMNTALHLI